MEMKSPRAPLIKTNTPFPLLHNEVAALGIRSATANGVTGDIGFSRDGCTGIDSYPKTEDFNSGKAAIGTGMYKFKEFTRGEEIVFERNDDYWGDKGAWENVTFRTITSDGPRVAELLYGDVALIDNPPQQDLERIKTAGYQV